MTDTPSWKPPRTLLAAWLGLLALLTLTVCMAYVPLGIANTPIALAIAIAKMLLIAAVFMELRSRSGLTIAFAAAGLFWLGIMMWLTFAAIPLVLLLRPAKPPGPGEAKLAMAD